MRHRQRQIRRKHPIAKMTGQPDPNHIRYPERDRHPKEDAFCFQAADTPCKDANAVDHRRMTVRTDQRVGRGPATTVFLDRRDDRREALEIERVHNAGTGRMNAEPGQRIRRPLHEAIPFGIALELAFHVEFKRRRATKGIYSQGVVRGDVHRDNRIEKRRIMSRLRKSRAHSRDIHECRTASGIVHHDTIGKKRDLQLARTLCEPVDDRSLGPRIIFACCTQNILQQDTMDVWKRPKLMPSLCWQVDDVVYNFVDREF